MATTTFKPRKAPSAPKARMPKISELDASAGNIDKSGGEYAAKSSGIKIRGTGAATKGTMARGPMA